MTGNTAKRGKWALLLLLLALVAALLAVPAASGAHTLRGLLDRSFGREGRAFSQLGDSLGASGFTSMKRQPDGKLLLAGWVERDSTFERQYATIVERRQSDGSLDPSFGEGGIVTVRDAGVSEGIAEVELQKDGSVLYAEAASGCTSSGSIHRLLPDGKANSSFGEDGGAVVPIEINRMALDPLGRILIAGVAYQGRCAKTLGPSEVAAARLLPEGRLDPSFGEGGIVRLGIGGLGYGPTVSALAVREDGDALITTVPEARLVALTPSGSLDPSFGTGGLVALPGQPRSLAVLPGGNAVVAGSTSASCCTLGDGFVVSRYLPNGEPDQSFGSGGLTRVAVKDVNEADELALGPDGGLLLAGVTADDADCQGAECNFEAGLLRLDASGVLDTGFGDSGWLPVDIPGRSAGLGARPQLAGLALAPDGQILFAGESGRASDAFVVARLGDGRSDPAFGVGGSIDEARPLPSSSEVAGVAIEAGGGIVVSAWSDIGSHDGRGGLLRFDSHGRPDARPGSGSGFAETGVGGAVRVGGRWSYMLNPAFGRESGWVARFDRLGQRDLGYGTEGAARLPSGFVVSSFLPRRDGSVLVLGRVARRRGLAVFLLTARGTAARDFGRGGVAYVRFGRRLDVAAEDAAVDSHHRIVLTGHAGPWAVAARLLADGRIDRSFGRRGRVAFAPDYWVEKTTVAISPGDGALIGISPDNGHIGAVTLRRLGAAGGKDRSFGKGGRVRIRHGGVSLLEIFPGRRQLLAAFGHGAWGEDGVTLRAYRPNGKTDLDFGHRGLITAASATQWPFQPTAAARQRNGQIVVAGRSGKLEQLGARVEVLRFR
jgi:uncharacterized delta-60 repeat protein